MFLVYVLLGCAVLCFATCLGLLVVVWHSPIIEHEECPLYAVGSIVMFIASIACIVGMINEYHKVVDKPPPAAVEEAK